MKKLLALICGIVLCMSMVACGNSDEKNSSVKEDSSSVTENSKAETSSGKDSSTTEISDIKTLEDFIAANNESFVTLNKQLDGTGASFEVFARDNSLVFSYKYTSDAIKNDDKTKKSLEASVKSDESSYKNLLEATRITVPSTKSVIVEYLDSKGEVISSFEFK